MPSASRAGATPLGDWHIVKAAPHICVRCSTRSSSPLDSRRVSGPSGGEAALSEVRVSAAQHGRDLLALGLSVDQVVHDYGDLCQAITDLAVEHDAPFAVDEFRTLNRCLDNAISDAVTEFTFQKDALAADANASASRQMMGHFAHELRNLLGTASLAFAAAKAGNLSLGGATGAILERSLNGLEQNAFKFTQPGTGVLLTAYATGEHIHIDVQDHCGGLGEGVAQTMFLPFSQAGLDRSGIGLGLTIARQSVAVNGGVLTVPRANPTWRAAPLPR